MTKVFSKKLNGIICPNCTYEIRDLLSHIDGINDVRASYIKSSVEVSYDAESVDEQTIIDTLEKKGYSVGGSRSNILTCLVDLLIIACLYFVLTLATNAAVLPTLDDSSFEKSLQLGLIFTTGLLGGFHCIGMCGGIMLTQNNAIAYNGGRILSYSLMGLLFGAVGSYIVFSAQLKSIVFIAAGSLVVLIGLRMWGVPFLRKLRPGLNSPCLISGFRGMPFTIGLLTGIMPCGMLSSMWFIAAATGSAFRGLFVMFVFAIGTCFCMLTFGLIGNIITRRYNKYILKISTIIIITMGLMLMIKGFNCAL